MSTQPRAVTPDNEPITYTQRSLLWRFREHWAGETASYRMGSFSAQALDCDGDFSEWWVKVKGEIVANGACHGSEPFDHFGQAIKACEDELVRLGALADDAGASP